MTVTRRGILGAGAGLGLAGLAGGATLLLRDAGTPDPAFEQIRHDPDNPVQGNPDGTLTIVEFFDYQCPFCKRDHAALIDRVRRDGDIRLVMKDWPIFGGASVLASQLVLGAAELGAYDPAHAALMATPARLSEAEIGQTLRLAGIDTDAAMAGWRAGRDRWEGWLARNAAQAAALSLRGTPAFLIGDTLYPGALGEAGLDTAISRARAAARA